jgi:hypothetical protein
MSIPPLEESRTPVLPGALAWHNNLAPQKVFHPVNVTYTQGSFFGCLNRTAHPLHEEPVQEKTIGDLHLYQCTNIRQLRLVNDIVLAAICCLAPVFFDHPDGPSLAAVLDRAKDLLGLDQPLEDWHADAPSAQRALDCARLWVMDHACILSFIIALSRWAVNGPSLRIVA